MASNPEGHSPSWWRKHPRAAQEEAIAQQNRAKALASKPPVEADKFNEVLGLISFAFTVASWGWTVIAPDSSTTFGSFLLLVAVSSMLTAIFRVWPIGIIRGSVLVIAALAGFVAFDWYVVIKPQKGKEFKALLVDGYHITSGCEGVPGTSQMPQWMRDQSKEWQAKVEQLISEKLDYKAIQVWRGTIIIGRVADENVNAYQCLWLANKVGALETIISTAYDPALKHRDYNGPTYWFNAVDGKVDISDAFKIGNGQANVYINGGTTPPPSQK
jgi:hypothetical protein